MFSHSIIESEKVEQFSLEEVDYILGETNASRLHEKILEKFMELSGAHQGAFIRLHRNELVEALCSKGDVVEVLDPENYEYNFPTRIVQYIQKTDWLSIDNIDKDDVFSVYAFCRAFSIRSVVAFPFYKQDVQLGFLLLGSKNEGFFDDLEETIKKYIPFATLALLNAYRFTLQKESLLHHHEEVKAQNDQIEFQNKVLEEQAKDLCDSLEYASRIQKTLLTEPAQLNRHFQDSFIIYQPKHIISGDFYWWDIRGSKAAIVAADCTGHGIPGAMLSFLGINILNQLAGEMPISDAAQLLNLLNFRLVCTLQPDDASHKILDGMDVAVCVVDFEKLTLSFSGAYNSVQIRRGNQLFELKGDRRPVAGQPMTEDDEVLYRTFTSQQFQLQKGDQVFVYSDGYADQFGYQDERIKKMGEKKLKELLQNSKDEKLADLKNRLMDFYHEWKQDQPQTDDLLLIGFEV